MTTSQCVRGFTLTDTVVTLLAGGVLLMLIGPAVGRIRGGSNIDVSFGNLATLAMAADMYAADWDGRQFTIVLDELGYYGPDALQALIAYDQQDGQPGPGSPVEHPPIMLGWDHQGSWQFPLAGQFISSNWSLVAGLTFTNLPFGYSRIPNTQGFHQYVDGRFYSPTYYAPNDAAAYKSASELFEDPAEFSLPGGPFFWSSYCFSAAALFDPDVMRPLSQGGWQDPFELGYGLQCPGFYETLYPDLKTHILEHNWNQSPPAMCNPAFKGGTYRGCEPYYFNHGIDSAPAALFYDGHVRLLPNAEALEADQFIMDQTKGVDGLWSRDTPIGPNGYYHYATYDGTVLSHHVLTTEGIRGRDTLVP